MKIYKQEFLYLYNKWRSTFIFSAHGSADPAAKRYYEELKEFCINHKEESLEYIRELLLKEPSDIVRLLDDLYKDKYPVKVEGFMPLDSYCNLWLNATDAEFDGEHIKDYYKDWREFHYYMKDNYISWNPFKENDPNVTFEEFKQGKRNETQK